MMPKAVSSSLNERIKGGMLAAAAILAFIQFAVWSGAPAGERALPFWAGVGVLFAILAAFGWATWHLLLRPLPAGLPGLGQRVPAAYCQALALLLGVGGLAIVVGGFWDEVWHRRYGLPFGDDFFWRPHLLMYFGFAAAVGLGFAALVVIIRRGRGTLQERFRADPALGLLILNGAFLLYVLPSDPIWHALYGEDLTAWSIPHLQLVLSFATLLLVATAVHMTARPWRAWQSIRRLAAADLLPLLLLAATSLMATQLLTTEWDAGSTHLRARPEWLLPVLIAGIAALTGVLANHTLRTIGAATLSGLLAVGLRLALIRLFDAEGMMAANAWLLALPSLVLIDLWYTVRPGEWAGAAGAAAAGMGLVLLALFDRIYPLFPVANVPLALLVVLAAGLPLAQLGAAAGDYLAAANKAVDPTPAGVRLSLATLGVVAAMAAFVTFFVVTARPPG